MAILEIISAANAAYAVIKQFAENGRETANLAKSIGTFLDAEDQIKEELNKKKTSGWAKVLGKDASDFEEFWHLEQLAQKRKELESYLQLYAPAGTHQRWVAFQVEARKRRKEAIKAAEKAREERNEMLLWGAFILFFISSMGYFFWWLGRANGKW